jgi:hypothetical protein
MRDFTINVLAGIFLMVVVWRMRRSGVLPRLEALYLSWERRLAAFMLRIAPIVIPILMLLIWGMIGFFFFTTKNSSVGYLFLAWSIVVWFVGPLFEHDRPLFRVISTWYQSVVSSEKTERSHRHSQ